MKEPIKINCKEPIHTVNEGFCHRITDNYHLMTAAMDQEELLHMVTSPPEVYLAEAQGAQIMNQTFIFNQKEMKIEMINNLLNRLSMRQEVHLNYQDKIYIENVLRKLGIKNIAHFLTQVKKQKINNQIQEEKIQNYWNLLESKYSKEEEIEEVRNTLNKRLEEQNTEYRNYLHEEIMNRLQTGVIYRILENFSQSAAYNSHFLEQSQIQFAEQKKISHQIFINQLENYFSEKQIPFVYLEKNQFEVMKEAEEQTEEAVQEQITQAVLLQLLNHIHMERLTAYKKEEQLWINFQNALYQSAENTIFRIKNQVQQTVENHLGQSFDFSVSKQENRPAGEREILHYREIKTEEREEHETAVNNISEVHFQSRQEKNIYENPEKIEQKDVERWETKKTVLENNRDILRSDVILQEIKEEPALKDKTKMEEVIMEHLEGKQKDESEQEISISDRLKEKHERVQEEEAEKQLKKQLQEIKEKQIESWQIHKTDVEKKGTYTEEIVGRTEEKKYRTSEEEELLEQRMLTYHVQYDKQEELQTLDTADGKGEKSQEEYREKILEKELHNNLQEINKKNIENWGTYRRILEEKSQTALVMPKTMEEKRIETLKALHAPEELLLEYKKEALAQKEQQEEAGKRMFEKLPEETRKVFELIESYQKSQDGHELTGIVKNDVRALQRDTHMILNHAEQRIKTEESQDVIQEREETERVVERWNYQNQKQSMQKNVHDTKKEISMVHKQMNQSIEEEVLQQLLEQNRSLVQKQIQNEVVHKEQVTVRKIENKEEKHIVQNHMKDITEMIDQGVKRQIGTISDQVYQRLERKLSNEKKRRGF